MTAENWYSPQLPGADVELYQELRRWLSAPFFRDRALRVVRDPGGGYYAVWTSWGLEAYRVTL